MSHETYYIAGQRAEQKKNTFARVFFCCACSGAGHGFFFPRFGSALVWLTLWAGPLVPWSPGPLVFLLVLVPWSSGPLVLWFPGPLVPWSSGSWSWSWSCGPLVPWSSGLSILWSLVAVFGINYSLWSFSKGLQKNKDICGFESLRRLRSQETANTVFADVERLRMLHMTAL